MCNRCFIPIDDEQIYKQIYKESISPNFEIWDNYALHYTRLIANGTSGYESQVIAQDLLNRYVKWRNVKYYENLKGNQLN